jgi:hypothetical protein
MKGLRDDAEDAGKEKVNHRADAAPGQTSTPTKKMAKDGKEGTTQYYAVDLS